MYGVYCYAFVVALKVKKVSLAQSRALTTDFFFLKTPDQE